MTMVYLHGMIPSSPIQRKQAIKKLFEQNPEGVIPINNKYQIHLKYDKDLQKLILERSANQEKETARKLLNKNAYSIPESNEKDW